MSQFAWEQLNLHNNYRSKHSSQEMQLDYSLCNDAQRYANQLANGTAEGHDPNAQGQGENIYTGFQSNAYPSGNNASKYWYSEKKNYDYNNPGFAQDTGHFTQVVWNDTTRFGIAKAYGEKNGMYATWVVARYAPQGNITNVGKFEENVKRY